MKKKKIIIIIISCIIGLFILGFLGYFIYIKNTYLSKDEVKEIILKDTKLSKEDITFKEIDLDLEKETKKYDVEFYYNRVEYNYEIDAKTGKIIYSDYINNTNINQENTNNNDTANNENSNNTTNDTNYISQEEAKDIALKDAKFSKQEVTFTDIDFEFQNGVAIYEVDFYKNNLEYEYKINAVNKNIISKNHEPRD